MALSVEKIGDVTIVTVNVKQFDSAYADQFKKEITPALKDVRKLVLDLSGVDFVDSRACGAILSCFRHLSVVEGELKICEAIPFVRSIFELIRLHRICEIVPTKEDALAAFAAK